MERRRRHWWTQQWGTCAAHKSCGGPGSQVQRHVRNRPGGGGAVAQPHTRERNGAPAPQDSASCIRSPFPAATMTAHWLPVKKGWVGGWDLSTWKRRACTCVARRCPGWTHQHSPLPGDVLPWGPATHLTAAVTPLPLRPASAQETDCISRVGAMIAGQGHRSIHLLLWLQPGILCDALHRNKFLRAQQPQCRPASFVACNPAHKRNFRY